MAAARARALEMYLTTAGRAPAMEPDWAIIEQMALFIIHGYTPTQKKAAA